MVYVSQLVRIGRICSGYEQFCERHYKLTQKLISKDRDMRSYVKRLEGLQKVICIANTTAVYVDILRTVCVCQPVMDSWATMSHIEDPVGLVARCFVHTQLSDISFMLTTA